MDKKQHLIDVQPIRSKEQLEDMKWSLKRHLQGDDGEMYGSSSKQENQIDLSYTGSIPVDTVLKLSVAALPTYSIQEKNINISDFQVTPVQDQGANLLRFTGLLNFLNTPSREYE
ncbi:hypothetical protein ACFMB7_33155 (plasmid) [Bacillus toyonensis]